MIWTGAANPELNTAISHLRDVLGDQTYESLVRTGKTKTTAEIVTYAHDQIEQARAELKVLLGIDDMCDSRKFVSKYVSSGRARSADVRGATALLVKSCEPSKLKGTSPRPLPRTISPASQ